MIDTCTWQALVGMLPAARRTGWHDCPALCLMWTIPCGQAGLDRAFAAAALGFACLGVVDVVVTAAGACCPNKAWIAPRLAAASRSISTELI